MELRKKLFLACREINNLGLTDKVDYHGLVPEDIIWNFVEAVEDIDDQLHIDDLSDFTIDLYELIVDHDGEDGVVKDLFDCKRPLYEKKHRKRKRNIKIENEWGDEPEPENTKQPTFTKHGRFPRKLDI